MRRRQLPQECADSHDSYPHVRTANSTSSTKLSTILSTFAEADPGARSGIAGIGHGTSGQRVRFRVMTEDQGATLYVNGNVFTMDRELPRAESMLVRNGRIEMIGPSYLLQAQA